MEGVVKDEDVAESTEMGPGAVRDVPVPKPDRSAGRAAVETVAEAEPDEAGKVVLSHRDAADATEWLLASFRDEVGLQTHTLRLNVGSLGTPKWLEWQVSAVEREVIDRLRDETLPSQNRAMRRQGAALTEKERQEAQWKLDVKLVVAGTIKPNIREALVQTAPGPGLPHLASPELFVEQAFRRNSGLVSQIAGAILTLSGYDEDNVSDVIEGAAAGNS